MDNLFIERLWWSLKYECIYLNEEVGEIKSPWFPGGLIAYLEDMLGRRVYIAKPDTIHKAIRDKVLSEAVPL